MAKKNVSVEVPAVLVERIGEYVQRDPELYHSREQFVLDAIVDRLGSMLDVENERLEERVMYCQERKRTIPSELRKQIDGYLKAAKIADREPDSRIKTVDDFIAWAEKYNREFKEARAERLKHMVTVDREQLDKLLAVAEKNLTAQGA